MHALSSAYLDIACRITLRVATNKLVVVADVNRAVAHPVHLGIHVTSQLQGFSPYITRPCHYIRH
jgi:hypothetical protein